MKKTLTILSALAIGLGCYWLGNLNGKRNAFWTSFADSIGLARILENNEGLTAKGKENLNKLSDIWLYGYFSEANPPDNEELKERIESGLVAIIEWKQENGYAVGPQEPLVGVKEGEIKDGKLFTDPMVEHFNTYKEHLDRFIEQHEIKIQPGGGINSIRSAHSVDTP
jgi:hypothetical protein